MKTTITITYSVETTYKGNESNPFENPANTLEEAEAMFAKFISFPEDNLIEVELVELGGEAKSLKTWNREMKTTPSNDNLLAAACTLAHAVDQLKALATGELIPNAFAGIWENEPAMIAPTMESIARQIKDAQTLLAINQITKMTNHPYPFAALRDMLQCQIGEEKSALIAWATDSDDDERARAVEAAFGISREKWEMLQADAPSGITYPAWAYALAIMAEERRLKVISEEEDEA